jgi:hypothetical protein
VIRLAALILCWSQCHAQEITIDHITAAVCQVESGTIWKSAGVVSGSFGAGASGEIGPWQCMPYVIRDLGRSESRARSSVAYSESVFRLWYGRLYARTGSHHEALAAYHRGYSGRNRKDAKAYAERALNLAHRLAAEKAQK